MSKNHRLRSASSWLFAAVAVGLTPSAGQAQVTTLTFGTPSAFCSQFNGSPTTPFGGLFFTNFSRVLVGGECGISNSAFGGVPASISAASGSAFSFRSANLAGAFSTTDITITGFLGGMTVFTQALGGLPNGQTSTTFFTNPSTNAIDRLEFSITGGNTANRPLFVDNFTFAVAQVTVVPEPATLALMGTGLLGVFGAAFVRRARSRA